ncbi:MAG: beta-lactamase family protein [Anaerolineales bacterium]|nr:beta-lactamase family protein [Anaerolineales bacterium]
MDSHKEYMIAGEIGKTLDHQLTPLIQEIIQSDEIPGLAVGVVAGNQIVYARGFGVESLLTRKPITMHTLFHMASISKPFVATAIMQLVEKGLVQLGAPFITYVPYFKLDDDHDREITVQQMLSHVSGMQDVENYEWDRPQYDAGALERYVRSLTSKRLLSAPGEKFAYSNMAFECLGALIANVSGMSFDEYVKKHILDPIGMADSTFLKPEHLPENWAAPHVRTLDTFAWDGYPYNRMHGPSSTLHSNALEMCCWAMANMNRGSYQGRQILAASSYDLLWKPWAKVSPESNVGLSWFLGEYHHESMVSHGGGDTGFETYFAMLPEKQAAVVVLSNLLPAPVGAISLSALDIVTGSPLTPILPYASIKVCKTLQQEGLEKAVLQWNYLKSNHTEEYDFSPWQFDILFNAVCLDRVQEAESIARLCARILPEEDLIAIEKDMQNYQFSAAQVVINAIREGR